MAQVEEYIPPTFTKEDFEKQVKSTDDYKQQGSNNAAKAVKKPHNLGDFYEVIIVDVDTWMPVRVRKVSSNRWLIIDVLNNMYALIMMFGNYMCETRLPINPSLDAFFILLSSSPTPWSKDDTIEPAMLPRWINVQLSRTIINIEKNMYDIMKDSDTSDTETSIELDAD